MDKSSLQTTFTVRNKIGLKAADCRSIAARSAPRSAGFSLLEVLISIIILSFGLLGMVGLQAAALQANREARLQSTAGAFARELAEMMRGNKDIGLLASANPYFGSFTSPLVPTAAAYCLNAANASVGCANGTAVANAEMTEWLSRVDSELPGARVTVCIDSTPYDSQGLPRWACDGAAGATTMIKLGWTRGSTDRSNTNTTPLDRASTPGIVFPITPGNTV